MNYIALRPYQFEAFKEDLIPLIHQAIKRAGYQMEIQPLLASIMAGNTIPIMMTNEGEIMGLFTLELDKERLFIPTMTIKNTGYDWLGDIYPMLCEIAREQGRSIIEWGGRKGWKRALKKIGAFPNGKFMRVEV